MAGKPTMKQIGMGSEEPGDDMYFGEGTEPPNKGKHREGVADMHDSAQATNALHPVEITPEAFQALVDETWNRHDADALAARFAEDGVVCTVATGETARGRDQIREWAEGLLRAFPDWHLKVTTAFGVAGRICAEFILTGTHEGEFQGIPPTHRPIEQNVCSVFTMNPEGLLEQETIYFDSATMLRQLGLLPEPGRSA